MDKIEQIKAEIERLKKILEESTYYLDNSQQALGYSFALDDFKEFIDSLPSEQPSEDLEKEVDAFIENGHYFPDAFAPVLEIARHFANWQKEQMMEMRWRKSSFGGLVPLSVIREMDADGKYYYHLGVTCPAGMEYFPVDKIQED